MEGVFSVQRFSSGDEVKIENLWSHGRPGNVVAGDVHLDFRAEFVGIAGDGRVGVVEGGYDCGENIGALDCTDDG